MYSIELWGIGELSVWLDLCLDLTMSGLFVDFGSKSIGVFVSVVDCINLFTLV